MGKTFLLVLCFILLSTDESVSQNFDLYVLTNGQMVKGSQSTFEDDLILYPEVNLGFRFLQNHRIRLALSRITATSYESLTSGNESGTELRLKGYPLAIEYQYDFFDQFAFKWFLKTSLTILPLKDQWKSDTAPEEVQSTNIGASFGFGAENYISDRIGIYTAVNYRLIMNNDERPPQYIQVDGVYAQLGLIFKI